MDREYSPSRHLLSANFKVVRSGEFVLFSDVPLPKSSFKRKQTKKELVSGDALLAQLPHTLRSLKQHRCELSRKQLVDATAANNIAISLFTSLVQEYLEFRALFRRALLSREQHAGFSADLDQVMEELQDEMTLANLVLSGQCLPQ